MSRPATLIIGTITVKHPSNWEDEDAEAIVDSVGDLVESHLFICAEHIRSKYPDLTFEVSV